MARSVLLPPAICPGLPLPLPVAACVPFAPSENRGRPATRVSCSAQRALGWLFSLPAGHHQLALAVRLSHQYCLIRLHTHRYPSAFIKSGRGRVTQRGKTDTVTAAFSRTVQQLEKRTHTCQDATETIDKGLCPPCSSVRLPSVADQATIAGD